MNKYSRDIDKNIYQSWTHQTPVKKNILTFFAEFSNYLHLDVISLDMYADETASIPWKV